MAKPGRKANGQFKKGHGGSKSRSRRSSSPKTTSMALVRAPAPQIIRVNAPRAMTVHKKKGGGKKRRSGGFGGGAVAGDLSGGIIAVLKRRLKSYGGSAGYGWITASGADTANKIKEFLDKVPTLDMIGKPATHGLGLTLVAINTGGMARQVADALGNAALHRAFYNLGANGFDFEKAAAVGDDEMAGDIEG